MIPASIQRFFERLIAMFRNRQMEHELNAELNSHLELAIEENIAQGLQPEEARRQALVSLGGMAQASEQHREARTLHAVDTFFQDVRYAARGIRKNPAFTAAAVLTLALGIGANATMFSLVSGYLLRRPPGHDPERVVAISAINPRGGMFADITRVSPPSYLAWRANNNLFTAMAAEQDRMGNLTWQGQSTALPSEAVSTDYFSTLEVLPLLGRIFAPGDDQPGREHIVILSSQLWDRQFGSDPSIIGRVIRLDREDYTVVGVMPDSFRLIGFLPQLWTPLVLSDADHTADARRLRTLTVFARTKPGVTLDQVRAEMTTLARRNEQDFPDSEKGWGIGVRTLPDFLIYSFGIRSALVVIMTVVSFILLIACANVAGLLLARAGARRKEMAIRMSLGSGRMRLVRQLLTEGLMIASLGGGLALVIAYWGVRVLRANMAFNPAVSAVHLSLDWNVMVFAFGISGLSAILCSLAPALSASKTDLNSSLKDETRAASAARSHTRLRSVLVIGEIAMALLLTIGTGLLVQGVLSERNRALGFRQDNLLTAGVALDHARYPDSSRQRQFVQELLPKLQQLPGVESVAAVTDLPATFAAGTSFEIEGQSESSQAKDKRPRALDFVTTPDFFRTAGIPLLRGRTFTARDNDGAPHVVVVNEKFVHQYLAGHEEDALGKRIRLDVSGATPQWSEIIGVVGNVKTFSESSNYDANVFEPLLQRPVPSFSLMIRTNSDPTGLASALRKTVAQSDAELPLSDVFTMSAVLDQQGGGDSLFVRMLATFAVLALVLAAIGIYGLISYFVGQRRHEIAIRMALGARGGDVLRMVLSQGLKMACIGSVIGLAVALPLPKLFSSMFEGMDMNHPQTFVFVLLAILLVAMMAAYIPARRASTIDPVKSLRSE